MDTTIKESEIFKIAREIEKYIHQNNLSKDYLVMLLTGNNKARTLIDVLNDYKMSGKLKRDLDVKRFDILIGRKQTIFNYEEKIDSINIYKKDKEYIANASYSGLPQNKLIIKSNEIDDIVSKSIILTKYLADKTFNDLFVEKVEKPLSKKRSVNKPQKRTF